MGIQADIVAGKYTPDMSFNYEPVPVDPEAMTVAQAKAHEEQQRHLAKDHRQKYRDEETRLQKVLEQDLAEHFGIAGHPRLPKLLKLVETYRNRREGLLGFAERYRDFAELMAR